MLEQSSKFVRVAAAKDGSPVIPSAVPAASKVDTTTGELGVRAATGTALDSEALTSTDYDFTPLDKTDTLNLLCIPPDSRRGRFPGAHAVPSAAISTCSAAWPARVGARSPARIIFFRCSTTMS